MSVITSINSFAVRADKACDYIPVVSTLSNLVDLFQKCVVLPLMSSSTTSLTGYYQHLQDKSICRSILLLIPFIGNIIVALHDKNHDTYSYMLEAIREYGEGYFKFASARLKKNEKFLIEAFIINPDIRRHIHFNSEDDRKAFLTKVFNRANHELCDYSESNGWQPEMTNARLKEQYNNFMGRFFTNPNSIPILRLRSQARAVEIAPPPDFDSLTP